MNKKRDLSPDERAAAAALSHAIDHSRKSQQAIANEVGVSQGQIWQWKDGKLPVPAARADSLATAVGITDPGRISVAYRKFQKKFHPEGVPVSPPTDLSAPSVDENDVIALQIALESLVKAISENLPAAAKAFSAQLRARAAAENFSTKAGLLAVLLGIAESDPRKVGASSARAKRPGSAGQ